MSGRWRLALTISLRVICVVGLIAGCTAAGSGGGPPGEPASKTLRDHGGSGGGGM